jgi:tRNA pseudouridine55 synthase
MDGLILVRKPETWTSHDVVKALRSILRQKKVGHFGTLDPLASGLLLAAVGKATRFFPFYGKLDKSYTARVRLGFATDTYDAEGRPTTPETHAWPGLEAVCEALRTGQGKLLQPAPPYSAKKLRGQPLYAYARAQKTVEAKAFPVVVYDIRLRSYVPPLLDVQIHCSSGTYIRSIAHDLGVRLGCGAHLAGLVRTEVGPYRLDEAASLDDIRTFHEAGRTSEFLKPMETLLAWLPKAVLTANGVGQVKHGRVIEEDGVEAFEPAPLSPAGPGEFLVRLFDNQGHLVGLARRLSSGSRALAPLLVLL